MILLINAHKEIIPEKINLQCVSENETSSETSPAQIRLASYIDPNCLWEFFIVNCSTISNPDYFGLTSSKKENYVELKYDIPVKGNYPVIMCYPPMVYESRWQQIIFATEIYHYFGTDLQIQYINSAMTEIVDILEIYQKKGFIKIEKFAYVDFDVETISKIGTNPMFELNFRNQPLALTDCLMKYREASEFIIVADIDDILFPVKKPFYNEFTFWSNIFSNSSAFMYHRSPAIMEIAEKFKEFSLEKTIKSIKIADFHNVGKTIYKTKNAEAAWIHWPGLTNKTTATVPPNEGKMLHMKIKKTHTSNLDNMKSFLPISEDGIHEISANFKSSFKDFSSIKSNYIYAETITDCYQNHQNKSSCLNPLQCKKPKFVKDFKCKVVRRDFITTDLSTDIVLHIPKSDYYWWTGDNGCTIFKN